MDKPNNTEMMNLVQNYRKIVLLYESLNEEIDSLIMAHGGGTENMSTEDMQRYRQLAWQRDELLNEMRTLEQQLSLTEDEEDVWKRADDRSL